uniref:Uncharacterized protein n=1 Tax=Romanomermis culicivorax TaxID=13658 RepID=A0A915KEQ1_ROMCU
YESLLNTDVIKLWVSIIALSYKKLSRKSRRNLIRLKNMENDILNCLSETERLRKKVSKFQQLLWIREDDLMEEIHEFHRDLIKLIEKHRDLFITKVKTNLFDIKKKIEAPIGELENRLEKVNKLKEMYKTLDNDSIAQVLSEIRADNLRLDNVYQNLNSSCMSQMKLTPVRMPGILGEFKDALEQSQILHFRYGQSPSVVDMSSHHLDTSSSSLSKISSSADVVTHKSSFGNSNYLITPQQMDYSAVPQAVIATSQLLNTSDSNVSLAGINMVRSIDVPCLDEPNGHSSQDIRRLSLGVGRGSRPFVNENSKGMGRSYQSSQYLITPGLNSSSIPPTQNDISTPKNNIDSLLSSKVQTSPLDRSADTLPANLIDLNINDLNAVANLTLNSVKSEIKEEPAPTTFFAAVKKEPPTTVEYWDDIGVDSSSARAASSSSVNNHQRRDNNDLVDDSVESSATDSTSADTTTATFGDVDRTKDTTKTRFDLSKLFRKGLNGTTTIRARSVLKLGAAKQTTPAEAYFKFPIGCTKNERNGDWLVCDTRHEAVKIYSKDGHPKVMINGAENPDMRFSSPSSVVALWNNSFVIKDNFSLFRFSEHGNLLATHSGRFKKLYGLCLDEQYNLLTLDLNARPKSLLLSIDPMSGKVLRETEFTAHRSTANSKCRFMDYFNRKLVVVDLGTKVILFSTTGSSQFSSRNYDSIKLNSVSFFANFALRAHQVYVCGDDCHLKFKFGEFQRSRAEPGRFNEPSGVAIDQKGHMLIGDSRNDRVQIWSNEGKWLGDVTFNERIVRPSNIHLTLDGHLMVMNYVEHYVNIFKLEDTLLDPKRTVATVDNGAGYGNSNNIKRQSMAALVVDNEKETRLSLTAFEQKYRLQIKTRTRKILILVAGIVFVSAAAGTFLHIFPLDASGTTLAIGIQANHKRRNVDQLTSDSRMINK